MIIYIAVFVLILLSHVGIQYHIDISLLDWKPETWAQVITAITALIAVVSSPFIQWKITQRQLSDNLSSKRQQWINELRVDFAELLSLHIKVQYLKPYIAKNENMISQYEEAFYKINELGVRLKLRLNPNEKEHNNLVKLMSELNKYNKQNEPINVQGFHSDLDAVINYLQVILKKEWERVKAGN